MKETVLVIAPHPDDETLGCGGTLLKHQSLGDRLYWLIVTQMNPADGFSAEKIANRKKEIDVVANKYSFCSVYRLNLPATGIDCVPKAQLIKKIGGVLGAVKPSILYLPHSGDAHSDHRHIAEASLACLKWFRYGSIRRALSYETLSETHFKPIAYAKAFTPNVYRDIAPFLNRKIEIMKVYRGELRAFPFPRSVKAIRALAALRGSECGYKAAESFMLLKERG